MSASKSSGYADKIQGGAKEAVGAVFSDRLQAEGREQRVKGQAEIDGTKARNQVEGAGESIVGGAKQGLGQLTGDTSLENRGFVERAQGKNKRALNEF